MGKDRVKAFIESPRIKVALNDLSGAGVSESNELLDFIYNATNDENILTPMLMEDAENIAIFTETLLSIYPDILRHVTAIPFEMFADYTADVLIIPNNIKIIDVMAFISASIKKLVIPESVTNIYDGAFISFSGSIIYEGSWQGFKKLVVKSSSDAFEDIQLDQLVCLKEDPNHNYADELIDLLESLY